MRTSKTSASDDQQGAGQRATVSNGAALVRLFEGWGRRAFPNEPISAAIADIQVEIDTLRTCLWTLERFWSTGARHTAARWTDDYWTDWDYLISLLPLDHPTAHTKARTAEEYIVLMATPLRTGRIDYKELKARIDIVEYATSFATLKKAGTTVLKGKCPLPNHEDKTASFFVYPHNQSWYCFGCAQGGDVIDLAHAMNREIR